MTPKSNKKAEDTQKKHHSILIVDDEPSNLQVLSQILHPLYQIKVAQSGEDALKIIFEQSKPDLILLDIMMPGMDGYAAIETIKSKKETASIPVIFITALSEDLDESRGLDQGAVDYIKKPIKPAIVLARVRTQLELMDARENLQSLVDERTKELKEANYLLKKSFIETVKSFSLLLETKDKFLAGHSRRVAEFSRKIAMELKLDQKDIDDIFLAGLLSRVGEITLPDKLIEKPFNLLEKDDRDDVINAIIGARRLFTNIPSLHEVGHIIECQFENFDGSGYKGLATDQIPIGSRILTMCRDYDLLHVGRMSSKTYSSSAALNYLKKRTGKYYDPKVFEYFTHVLGANSNKYIESVREIGLADLVPGMFIVNARFGQQIYVRNLEATNEIIDGLEDLQHQLHLSPVITVKLKNG